MPTLPQSLLNKDNWAMWIIEMDHERANCHHRQRDWQAANAQRKIHDPLDGLLHSFPWKNTGLVNEEKFHRYHQLRYFMVVIG